MNNEGSISTHKSSASDAVVSGLYAGVLAGLVMLVYLVIAGLVRGQSPQAVLGLFSPGKESVPLLGGFVHLAVSGIYGSFYGLVRFWIPERWRSRLPGWFSGMVYGLLLFALAKSFLLPGMGSPLQAIPVIYFGLAHVIYGLVLGILDR